MTSQEKWVTSGASRLKARQNRGFSYRAKQRASTGTAAPIMDNKRGEGRKQTAKRRRIIVGQTASSEVVNDPYTNAALAAAAGGAISQGDGNKLQSHLQQLDELTRGIPRRVRQIPTTIQPRSHLGDAAAALAGGVALPSSSLGSTFRDPLTEAIVLGSLRDRAAAAPSAGSLSDALFRDGVSSAALRSYTGSQRRAAEEAQQLRRLLSSAGSISGASSNSLEIGDKYVLSQWLSNAGGYQHPSTSPLASLSSFSADARAAASLPPVARPTSQDALVQELIAAARGQGQQQQQQQQQVGRASSLLQRGEHSNALLDSLRDTMQQRLDNESKSRSLLRGGGSNEPKGIAKFQAKPSTLSQPSPSSTLTTEKSNASSVVAANNQQPRGQQQQQIRLFNNGTEINVNGRPKHAEILKPPKAMLKKKHRRTASDKAREAKKRQEEFVNLQARQQSIWDAFTPEEEEEEAKEEDEDAKNEDEDPEDDADDKEREEEDAEVTSEESNKKKDAPEEEEDSSNNSQDSIQERERTLSAASVLMALSPRIGSN